MPSIERLQLHGMVNSLFEVKNILDDIMEELDDWTRRTNRVLETASLKLLKLADYQHSLPDELNRRLSKLISHLRQKTHPEIRVAEIKRFYGALLAAIQQPTHCKTK